MREPRRAERIKSWPGPPRSPSLFAKQRANQRDLPPPLRRGRVGVGVLAQQPSFIRPFLFFVIPTAAVTSLGGATLVNARSPRRILPRSERKSPRGRGEG